MKVAAIQIEITEANPNINRDRVDSLLEESASADLYLLPELWSSGYCHKQWQQIAERDTPITTNWMAKLARKRNAWFGGTVIFQDEQEKLYNRFFLFNRSGRLVGYYDKVHLFPLMDEDQYLQPGKILFITDVDGFRVALATCYDLRFPEMFRKMALDGIDLFLVPCEWPASRKDTLVTLAAARAIESQAYLVLANRVGFDSAGQLFAGKSAIFGPQGMLNMAESDEQNIVSYDIDKQELISSRNILPVLKHRIQGI